jgi:hypothetical protein
MKIIHKTMETMRNPKKNFAGEAAISTTAERKLTPPDFN